MIIPKRYRKIDKGYIPPEPPEGLRKIEPDSTVLDRAYDMPLEEATMEVKGPNNVLENVSIDDKDL